MHPCLSLIVVMISSSRSRPVIAFHQGPAFKFQPSVSERERRERSCEVVRGRENMGKGKSANTPASQSHSNQVPFMYAYSVLNFETIYHFYTPSEKSKIFHTKKKRTVP